MVYLKGMVLILNQSSLDMLLSKSKERHLHWDHNM